MKLIDICINLLLDSTIFVNGEDGRVNGWRNTIKYESQVRERERERDKLKFFVALPVTYDLKHETKFFGKLFH